MNKERIMVVEDEKLIARDIKDCLEKLGYSVTSIVATGEAAVRRAEEDSPDLALMDIRLEGEMDGVEAAELIMSRFKIPVVYMTAHADENILQRAKATGPFGYVLKPFEERELYIAIQMAIYRHRAEKRLMKNQAELRANEKILRLTLDAASDGGWDWDIPAGTVHYSDKWIQSLGYEREDVEPHVRFWENIVHPDDMPGVMQKLTDHFEGRVPIYQVENRLRKKSGEYRWNLDRGMVISRGPDGKPLRMVGTATDISDRKRAEEELRIAKEQAEEATKLKDKFVSLVAHDLRGPLATLLGYLGLINDESSDPEQTIHWRVGSSGPLSRRWTWPWWRQGTGKRRWRQWSGPFLTSLSRTWLCREWTASRSWKKCGKILMSERSQ
ncbi:MAG: response regulator [Nitrospinae bacterium]|nr:response regulator [Nitrospinota bacterium]